MPKHLDGGKFGGTHTTVLDCAYRLLRRLAREDAVTKIVLGMISVKPCKLRYKIDDIPAGIKVTFYGNGALQEVYVYTASPELAKSFVRKGWSAS